MLDWLNNNKFFKTWIFSTNHKIIGTLYFFFGSFSAYLGVFYSFILRTELATQVRQWFTRNNNFFKVVVAPYVFLGVMLVLKTPLIFELPVLEMIQNPRIEMTMFVCDNGEEAVEKFNKCIKSFKGFERCNSKLEKELSTLNKCSDFVIEPFNVAFRDAIREMQKKPFNIFDIDILKKPFNMFDI